MKREEKDNVLYQEILTSFQLVVMTDTHINETSKF